MVESAVAILIAVALLYWTGRSMDHNEAQAQDREKRERLAEIERVLNKGQR